LKKLSKTLKFSRQRIRSLVTLEPTRHGRLSERIGEVEARSIGEGEAPQIDRGYSSAAHRIGDTNDVELVAYLNVRHGACARYRGTNGDRRLFGFARLLERKFIGVGWDDIRNDHIGIRISIVMAFGCGRIAAGSRHG